MKKGVFKHRKFQHTAARRRLAQCRRPAHKPDGFQHTAARRRLGSRPGRTASLSSFNTQPPEGGWRLSDGDVGLSKCFNTQPPEGGWNLMESPIKNLMVSTHSRPKAAGSWAIRCIRVIKMFQHTAARRRLASDLTSTTDGRDVSTHSRPKAAGRDSELAHMLLNVSTHSRPKAAGKRMNAADCL